MTISSLDVSVSSSATERGNIQTPGRTRIPEDSEIWEISLGELLLEKALLALSGELLKDLEYSGRSKTDKLTAFEWAMKRRAARRVKRKNLIVDWRTV